MNALGFFILLSIYIQTLIIVRVNIINNKYKDKPYGSVIVGESD